LGSGPVLIQDAVPIDPLAAPPGWFAAVEIGVVKPHVTNRLLGTVPLDGSTADTVHLPNASLDWTAAPLFEGGYRLPDGWGEILLSYRFLQSQGRGTLPNFDVLGPGDLNSRLDLDVIDLDYGSREYPVAPAWALKWYAGARVTDLFFDSRAQGLFVGQRTSNQFVGAGPHGALEVRRRFAIPGLEFFARLDGAVVIGRIRQGFEETFTFADGSVLGTAANASGTQGVPTINFRLGLDWTPAGGSGLRFGLGYEYEHWWYVGDVGSSHANLSDQGLFFRGEFNY
jgi:hypothetical protein